MVPLLPLIISIHTRACFFTGVSPRARNFLARARVRVSGLARLIELIMPKFILDGKLVLACALAGPVLDECHCVGVLTVAFSSRSSFCSL